MAPSLSLLPSFLFNRKRNSVILWTAVATGGVYLLGKYALAKIEELTRRHEIDRLAQQNIRRRFDQNQQDCTLTLLSLLPTMAECLLQSERLDVESLTVRLKQHPKSSGDGATDESRQQQKLAMWNELKVKSLARTITAAYSFALLALLVRVQLNLIGRFTYLNSLDTLEAIQEGHSDRISMDGSLHIKRPQTAITGKSLSFQSEQKYLCLSWFLLNRGVKQFAERALTVTESILASMELAKPLTSKDFEDVIDQIRQRIEAQTMDSNMIEFILPPPGQEGQVIRSGLVQSPEEDDSNLPITVPIEEDLQIMLEETREIMESVECKKVAKSLVDAVFVKVNRTIRTNLFKEENLPHTTKEREKIVELPQNDSAATKPLVSFLPEVSKVAHQILNSFPNEYAKVNSERISVDLRRLYKQELADNVVLNALAAVIYCRFEQ